MSQRKEAVETYIEGSVEAITLRSCSAWRRTWSGICTAIQPFPGKAAFAGEIQNPGAAGTSAM